MKLTRRPRCILLYALPLALFAFWFITAPAVGAIQRIIAGGPSGGFSRFLSNAAEAYEAPMYPLCRIPLINDAANALADFWLCALDAPDTTP
jgi:hypothetical protein